MAVGNLFRVQYQIVAPSRGNVGNEPRVNAYRKPATWVSVVATSPHPKDIASVLNSNLSGSLLATETIEVLAVQTGEFNGTVLT